MAVTKRKIAVIGVGKIAIDQHFPVIEKSDRFEVAATVSARGIAYRNLPVYLTAAELYVACPEIELVAICTPPSVRHALALEALDTGKDVLMEKPPTASVAEFYDLVSYAKSNNRLLFQTWHSQYNHAVDRAREILRTEGVNSAHIDWRESARKWHPGQDWVWEPGGFGVCDPGINALSIFTKIMPFPVFVDSATLGVPANRQTPVDVRITFKSNGPGNPDLGAHFNWLESEQEVWQIRIETGAGRELLLDRGGSILTIDGARDTAAQPEEYERIYERFAHLLDADQSDVDGAPLVLMADVFLRGVRETLPAFDW